MISPGSFVDYTLMTRLVFMLLLYSLWLHRFAFAGLVGCRLIVCMVDLFSFRDADDLGFFFYPAIVCSDSLFDVLLCSRHITCHSVLFEHYRSCTSHALSFVLFQKLWLWYWLMGGIQAHLVPYLSFWLSFDVLGTSCAIQFDLVFYPAIVCRGFIFGELLCSRHVTCHSFVLAAHHVPFGFLWVMSIGTSCIYTKMVLKQPPESVRFLLDGRTNI